MFTFILHTGAIAVIGPYPKKTEAVPLHMLVSRQRLRPGSGCLAVHIRMDGPTRVLQISDIQSTKVDNSLCETCHLYMKL